MDQWVVGETTEQMLRKMVTEQALRISRLEARVTHLKAANDRLTRALDETTQQLRKARKFK